MYLLIDVGNTRIKWLLLKGNEDLVLGSQNDTQSGTLVEFESYIGTLDTSQVHVLLAAVNQTEVLMELLEQSGFCDIFIAESKSQQAGLRSSYSQPERMGVDRWLAMVAAYSSLQSTSRQTDNKQSDRNSLEKILPTKNSSGVIVVDAGSALTIDVVSAEGLHLGGYIVPGILMAQRALYQNTERVIQYNAENLLAPLNSMKNKLGKNTHQCVEYGVINQLAALVQVVVSEYAEYELLITGGDSDVLAKFFPTIRIERDLVLKGLWQVRN